MTEMFRYPRVLMTTCAVAACSSAVSPDPDAANAFTSQGIVVGAVRDTAGRGVANAVVCATAVFTVSGTPVLAVGQGPTNANGAYLVPINLTFRAEVRGALTVAATPAMASGLEPAYKPGLTVLITTALPPAETTHVDLVVVGVQVLAKATRTVVLNTFPGVIERVNAKARLIGYGYAPGYRGLVATILLSQEGVKLGILRGSQLSDPSGLLQGGGKLHRHIPLTTLPEVQRAPVRALLKAALAAWKERSTVGA